MVSQNTAAEPFDLKLKFRAHGKLTDELAFKPIFYPGAGREFLVFRVGRREGVVEVVE